MQTFSEQEQTLITRANNIQQTLGKEIPYLQSIIDCIDDAEAICCWYDCEYTLCPDYYPNPILGL